MVSLFVVLMAPGPMPSPRRKTDSMTESSVAVVSRPFHGVSHLSLAGTCGEEDVPVTAIQSFTTIPAPTTDEPLLTLPATSGTCSKLDSSSWSWIDVLGCTIPPWLLSDMYEPTSTLSAMVWRKTSTPSTSAMLFYCQPRSFPSFLYDQLLSTKAQNKPPRKRRRGGKKTHISSVSLSISGCTNAT